jgi:hypothetical protein
MSALYPQGPEDNYHPTIEVRVMTLEDYDRGAEWAEIAPVTVFVGTVHLPEDVVKSMADSNEQVWEVRWNWGPGYYRVKGLVAGHYVPGPARGLRPGRNVRIVEVK